MSWIETSTGNRFYMSNPDMHAYDIKEIAHALSNTCRFNGHCKEFISVAEHSVLVAMMLPEEIKIFGLLHDASEAYYGDVVTPLKDLLPTYQDLEKRCQFTVYEQLAGRQPIKQELQQLKKADLKALKIEARKLLPMCGSNWQCLDDVVVCPSMDVHVRCLEPRRAEELFLDAIGAINGGAA